jgi:hypothetical protein
MPPPRLPWDNHKSGQKKNGSNRKTNQSAGIEKTVAILATAIPARAVVVAAVVEAVAVAQLAVAAALVAVVVAADVIPGRAISEPPIAARAFHSQPQWPASRRGDEGKAE